MYAEDLRLLLVGRYRITAGLPQTRYCLSYVKSTSWTRRIILEARGAAGRVTRKKPVMFTLRMCG